MVQFAGMERLFKILPLILFIGCASEDEAPANHGAKPVFGEADNVQCASATGAYLTRKVKKSGNCEYTNTEEILIATPGQSTAPKGCTNKGRVSANNCEEIVAISCEDGSSLNGSIKSSQDGTYGEGLITQKTGDCSVTAIWTLTKQ